MSAPLGRNYWKLWTASVVSNFGDGVSLIAYPWLASAVTRDPVQIALVAVATRLPWLIFTLPAGVITDRVDRRKLVAWMDVVRFGLTLGVALIVLTVQDQLATPEAIAAGTAALPEQRDLAPGDGLCRIAPSRFRGSPPRQLGANTDAGDRGGGKPGKGQRSIVGR